MKTTRTAIMLLIIGSFLFGNRFVCLAQNLITIGTGTNYNSYYNYPAPYGNYNNGAKHQFLIRSTELTSAGASAGNFVSLAFNVAVVNGVPLQNFTIKIKTTSSTSVSSAFETTGFTTVWGPQTYTESAGWNTHSFSTPFYWNGSSNLLIDVCFYNSSASYTNAQTYYTYTSFYSANYYNSSSSTVCQTSSGYTSTNRPNMQLGMPATAPPVPDFTSNKTETCNGLISFQDLSFNVPTSWLWNFGDGATSTLKNPTHTYTADGNYTVSLKACNSYGCDSVTQSNYITVYSLGTGPINASCSPGTTYLYSYYGIFNVTFNTINNTTTSGDGYHDYTCDYAATVIEGMSYAITVQSGTYYDEDVRVWIDFNNNGSFTSSELVYSSDNVVQYHYGTISIPSSATKNQPLRMRVLSDDSYGTYAPCSTAYNGQFEDYTVTVTPNTFPPEANLGANKTITCSGTVSFYDSSIYVPNSWLWDFGDGTTSVLQNPTHSYSNTGIYTVKLKVCNSFGCDSVIKTGYIDVRGGGEPVSMCTPLQSTPLANYGIYRVKFNAIDISSGDALEGNEVFTCEGRTYVIKGQSYPITVNTGSTNMQDVRVWIDYNNNGIMDYTELAFSSDNIYGDHTGTITIPTTAVANTPLRMRVLGDYYTSSACSSAYYGQFEDYAILVLPSNIAPIGDFSYEVLDACQGIVKFSDLSMPNPSSWKWDFGDGFGLSVSSNPYYTFQSAGTYLVSMIVSNPYGNDTVKKSIVINSLSADFSYTQNGNTFEFTGISPGATNWSWDFGDGYNASFQNPVHTYASADTYTVKLLTTNSSGCMKQVAHVITITGIAEAFSNEHFELFPNPATDNITVEYEFTGVKNISMRVLNVLGETVYSDFSGNATSYYRTITLSAFSKGVYFVKMQTDDNVLIKRIVLLRN